MSKKGGYIIANLNNVQLTSGTAANIPQFINPNGKAVLLSGLNIGGTEYPDMWVFPQSGEIEDGKEKYENMLGTFEFNGAQVTYTQATE